MSARAKSKGRGIRVTILGVHTVDEKDLIHEIKKAVTKFTVKSVVYSIESFAYDYNGGP